MADKPLTPEEKSLQMEGEALLRKVTGQKEGAVVGPDGAPLKPKEGEEKPPEQPLNEEEAKKLARQKIDDHVGKLKEAAAKERDAALKNMSEVCKENVIARKCMQVMLHAHRLIAWAKLEMQTLDERVGDKDLMHLERQIHGAVHTGDFTSQSLLHDVRKAVCEFLKERNQLYEEVARRRKAKIGKTIDRMGDKGFQLPCKSLMEMRDKKMGGRFVPGHLLLLYGPEDAIAAGLQLIGNTHMRESEVHHFLVTDEKPETEMTTVAASWWRNCLQSICKFYDTLEPVVESPSTMLLIDDMNLLLLAGEQQMAVVERKNRILTALRQWAIEHHVIVVAGDPVAKEFLKARKYGGLPCASVLIEEKDDKQYLVIEGEEICITREEE